MSDSGKSIFCSCNPIYEKHHDTCGLADMVAMKKELRILKKSNFNQRQEDLHVLLFGPFQKTPAPTRPDIKAEPVFDKGDAIIFCELGMCSAEYDFFCSNCGHPFCDDHIRVCNCKTDLFLWCNLCREPCINCFDVSCRDCNCTCETRRLKLLDQLKNGF